MRWLRQIARWAAGGLLPGAVASACNRSAEVWARAHESRLTREVVDQLRGRLEELEGQVKRQRLGRMPRAFYGAGSTWILMSCRSSGPPRKFWRLGEVQEAANLTSVPLGAAVKVFETAVPLGTALPIASYVTAACP